VVNLTRREMLLPNPIARLERVLVWPRRRKKNEDRVTTRIITIGLDSSSSPATAWRQLTNRWVAQRGVRALPYDDTRVELRVLPAVGDVQASRIST